MLEVKKFFKLSYCTKDELYDVNVLYFDSLSTLNDYVINHNIESYEVNTLLVSCKIC